jgi:hypothetical protein
MFDFAGGDKMRIFDTSRLRNDAAELDPECVEADSVV